MLEFDIVPVTPFQQNCTVLWCQATKRAVIVDPGGDLERILAAVSRHQVEVEKIWLTHGHLDHAGGAGDLKARLGVPIEGPEEQDRFLIDGLAKQMAMYGLPAAKPFTPDRWLVEGDRVTIGNLSFAVLHCPGHTPGHIAYVNAEARLALVGDVLFQGSIGRTDFPRGDQAALIASIKGKLFPLGDDMAFIPGHGPMSTIAIERRSNPFVHD
ncbi:MAG: MBL fold metallo-hydrolase [Alphaproteobacteria bacterium]|nr:MBL fold metallo-hydrolase [Alphaproteobacteria bacterium]